MAVFTKFNLPLNSPCELQAATELKDSMPEAVAFYQVYLEQRNETNSVTYQIIVHIQKHTKERIFFIVILECRQLIPQAKSYQHYMYVCFNFVVFKEKKRNQQTYI